MGLTEPMATCDYPGCTETFTVADSFSMLAWVATCGPNGQNIGSFDCPGGQHFYHSEEHMILGVKNCIDNHLVPHFDTLLAGQA